MLTTHSPESRLEYPRDLDRVTPRFPLLAREVSWGRPAGRLWGAVWGAVCEEQCVGRLGGAAELGELLGELHWGSCRAWELRRWSFVEPGVQRGRCGTVRRSRRTSRHSRKAHGPGARRKQFASSEENRLHARESARAQGYNGHRASANVTACGIT